MLFPRQKGRRGLKIGAIIQTRMGSTRLPGKVMINILGKPVIQHVIERLKQSKKLDEIIIATTNLEQDNIIVEQAQKNGVKWYRGSEEDVLSRYHGAALEYKIDTIVRLTSDCPFIDPFITDSIIKFFTENGYDVVTNAGSDLSLRTFPRGLDTEVFSFNVLRKAFDSATEKYQREHVTPYLYENCPKIYHYRNDIDYSKYRWTLDTTEDLKMISAVYGYLYHGKHDFYLKDILELLNEYPEISQINQHVEQKKIK